jgi:signal transduction histidine kinase
MGIASHELRTPLTTIKTAIQLVQRWAKDIAVDNDMYSDKFEAMIGLLERADRQVGTLNRLIGDLLDVSRIQANKLSLQMKTCDLTEIVRDVVNEQRQAVEPRPILLHVASGCEAVPVLADAERIAQVLMNYLTNALKYSAVDRAVSVSVSLEEEKCVRVAVRDEGPGLSSQEQERVWERFQQIERIKSRGNQRVGLGLGLYINRMIVMQHNGQVGVESVLGEGSTFWFTLPRLQTA